MLTQSASRRIPSKPTVELSKQYQEYSLLIVMDNLLAYAVVSAADAVASTESALIEYVEVAGYPFQRASFYRSWRVALLSGFWLAPGDFFRRLQGFVASRASLGWKVERCRGQPVCAFINLSIVYLLIVEESIVDKKKQGLQHRAGVIQGYMRWPGSALWGLCRRHRTRLRQERRALCMTMA